MNIHLPAILGFTRYQGFAPWPDRPSTASNGFLGKHRQKQTFFLVQCLGRTCTTRDWVILRFGEWAWGVPQPAISSWETHPMAIEMIISMTAWWLSPTPLKNMTKFQLGCWHSQCMENKSHVPNHQPDEKVIYMGILRRHSSGLWLPQKKIQRSFALWNRWEMVRGGPKIIPRCPGVSFMGTGIATRFSVDATGTMGVAVLIRAKLRMQTPSLLVSWNWIELIKSEGSRCLSTLW